MNEQELIQHLWHAYRLKADRIVPYKTVHQVFVGDQAYVLKRVKSRRVIQNVNYLSAQKFTHAILPLLTVDGQYVTTYKGKDYYLLPYHANIDYPHDKRLLDYIDLLIKLHQKTRVIRPFDTDGFIRIYEKQKRDLADRFLILDAFMAECETTSHKSVFKWYYLSQYPKIIGMKQLLTELQQQIDNHVSTIDHFSFSLIHNRPSLDHFIVTNEKNYLINFEYSVISLPIYDYIQLFIEYCDFPIDWYALVEREAMSPFEVYLFVFQVIYTIVLNFDVTTMKHSPDVIAINHFVYSYGVIEQLIQLYQKWKEQHHSIGQEEVEEAN